MRGSASDIELAMTNPVDGKYWDQIVMNLGSQAEARGWPLNWDTINS